MNNLRVVLVEDDPGLCILFRRMLDKLGHVVVDSLPLDGAAVEKTREIAPDLIMIDVVLTDTHNSLELARELTLGLGIPGILISNHGIEHLSERDESVLGYQFLRKPFFVTDLAHAIKKTLLCEPGTKNGHEETTLLNSEISDAKQAPGCAPTRGGKKETVGSL